MLSSLQGVNVKSVTRKAGATLAATFDRTVIHGTAHAGKAVAVSGGAQDAGEVELVATNGIPSGRLSHMEPDKQCNIEFKGFVVLPTDGTSITYGSGLVGGATAGTVKTGANPTCIAHENAGTNLVLAEFK